MTPTARVYIARCSYCGEEKKIKAELKHEDGREALACAQCALRGAVGQRFPGAFGPAPSSETRG